MLSRELLISKISDRILQMVHDSEISENFDCLEKRSEVSNKVVMTLDSHKNIPQWSSSYLRYNLEPKSMETGQLGFIVQILDYRGRNIWILRRFTIALYKHKPKSS